MSQNSAERNEKYIINAYEADANRFSIKCQFFSMIFPFVAWLLNCAGIFIVDSSLIFYGLVISFIVTVLTVVICKILGMKNKATKYCAMAGIVIAICVQSAMLTYHIYIIMVLPIIYSLQYGQRKMVYYTYILSVISIVISVYIGYYYGLCDANMVVLTRGNIKEYVDASGVIFNAAPVNSNPAFTLLMYYIVPRAMILMAVVFMVIHISDTIASKAVNEEHLRHLSENDDMTGVYNRNKYLDMIKHYYPYVSEVAVIFWDVNGLKRTNDRLGHESGDVLIKSIASCIVDSVDFAGRIFRIGGDEFVAIIENSDIDVVEGIIERYNNVISSMNINRIDGIEISASVGMAYGEGRNIEDIVKKADTHMYNQKKLYKKARE